MNQIVSSAGLIQAPAIQDIARTYGVGAAAFVFTFRSIAMPQPHTEAEFLSCVLVAREHRLNPLTKEIYFMRTKSGQIQPIVSVDGWIKKANEHPQFDGLEITNVKDDNGDITEMTIAVYRKDRSRPTVLTEYMDECRANGGPVWKTASKRMLRNRVICQGIRVAFGFGGIMELDEFLQWQRTDTSGPLIDEPPNPDDAAIPMDDDNPAEQVADVVEGVPDDSMSDAESARLIAKVRDELSTTSDEIIRLEIWEAHAELFERMSPARQREVQAIYEGRA